MVAKAMSGFQIAPEKIWAPGQRNSDAKAFILSLKMAMASLYSEPVIFS